MSGGEPGSVCRVCMTTKKKEEEKKKKKKKVAIVAIGGRGWSMGAKAHITLPLVNLSRRSV